ncbi:MAG: flagellar filament capping protein FliD [Lachnospiraceae bacterium]|nr:flagellar filament capping protein FliD [Lachnospiraceae bacterium]
MDYEFQFNIGENDSNKNIQDKLARLISRSNIGVHAEVVADGSGNTALKLTSSDTGYKGDTQAVFNVSDNRTSKASGVVNYLGMANVTAPPKNAEFVINGTERSATTNHFTVDRMYDLTLVSTTAEDEKVTVGFKTDTESLTENVSKLIDGYNSFIEKTKSYVEKQPQAKALLNEMRIMTTRFGKELEDIGVGLSTEGLITLDDNKLKQTVESPDALDKLKTIRDFANSVLKKTTEVALDPMQYTMRKVVEYKNPGHNFSAPYAASSYSGMMFSGYC